MDNPRATRIGLVLGAGGVLGGAWMAGALHAIADRTRFYPRHAEYIVGTSAGSVLAALGAAGVPPWLLIPESSANIYHGLIDADGNLELAGDLWARIVRRTHLGLPSLRPGSVSLVRSAFGQPGWTGVMRVLTGLLPAGFISTDPIKETIRWVAPRGGWVQHPNCWIVACDYASGERVVFGRDAEADIGQAVAASCAIPGFYCPEQIGERFYIDGGLHSMSNADLLFGLDLDLVVCLNPLSARHGFAGWDPVNRMAEVTRRAVARQLDAEVATLRDQGTPVLVLEPTPDDLAAIGANVMDERRRAKVLEVAIRTTTAQLEMPGLAPLVASLQRREPSRPRRRLQPRLRPAV